jgi:hypothetical protein
VLAVAGLDRDRTRVGGKKEFEPFEKSSSN